MVPGQYRTVASHRSDLAWPDNKPNWQWPDLHSPYPTQPSYLRVTVFSPLLTHCSFPVHAFLSLMCPYRYPTASRSIPYLTQPSYLQVTVSHPSPSLLFHVGYSLAYCVYLLPPLSAHCLFYLLPSRSSRGLDCLSRKFVRHSVLVQMPFCTWFASYTSILCGHNGVYII